MHLFAQEDYPKRLYRRELSCHNAALEEYAEEIVHELKVASENCKTPIRKLLLKQQPYLTANIRLKLIDFCMKMGARLKIIPFVMCKAVALFDRYCSTRVMLLDQAQLIITTCLWIAAKVQGGNNHFVNMQNAKLFPDARTINDLGFGAGGKYVGPTQRFRMPKLSELVKLCGASCNYDEGMFRQMELHILLTLDWQVNDANLEDYIVQSKELDCTHYLELFKTKEFVSYCKLFSESLVEVSHAKFATVALEVINEFGGLSRPQTPNICIDKIPVNEYKRLKKHVIVSIILAPVSLLGQFSSAGPQTLFTKLTSYFTHPYDSYDLPRTHGGIPAPHRIADLTTGSAPAMPPSRRRPLPIANPLLLLVRPEILHHSASQVSIASASSLEDASTSIFDTESTGAGTRSPLTDEESPKQVERKDKLHLYLCR